jgi:AraC-like DNA-binding protein
MESRRTIERPCDACLEQDEQGNCVQDCIESESAENCRQRDVDLLLEISLFERPVKALEEKIKYYRRLANAYSLIKTDYVNPELSLSSATKACGIQKDHLNVLLKRVLNLTFYRFLTRYRILSAAKLFQDHDFSILEATLNVGFGSISSFERNCKKILQITPSTLKRLNHNSLSGEYISIFTEIYGRKIDSSGKTLSSD